MREDAAALNDSSASAPIEHTLPVVADRPELELTAEPAPAREKPPSLWAYPATYLLLGVNILVFAVMFPHSPAAGLLRQQGAHLFTAPFHPQALLNFLWQVLSAPFDADTLARFGASDPGAELQGQWWRLVTSTFVHVTILHLAVNMWCLWNLGLFGEPLLGRPGLIAVYLLTGASGMMLSLASFVFGGQGGLVAGASGAVFGVAGILIVLLSNRKLSLPWKELRSLRRSVIWFAVLNLAIGLAPEALPALSPGQLGRLHLDPASLPHVANSAHLGGFVSGIALGLPLFPRMTSGKSSYRARQALVFAAGALLLCLFGYSLAVRVGA